MEIFKALLYKEQKIIRGNMTSFLPISILIIRKHFKFMFRPLFPTVLVPIFNGDDELYFVLKGINKLNY